MQAGIQLAVEAIDIQAVIDMETGIIGFTQSINGKMIEYSWASCPVEYRLAFMNAIQELVTNRCHLNTLISRKGKDAEVLRADWNETDHQG